MKKLFDNNNLLAILYIVILPIFIYWIWFFKFDILTYGDWGFFFKESQLTLFSLPYIWVESSFGSIFLSASSYFSYLFMGLLGFLNNFSISERIIYFWPSIIFASTGSYILINKILNNKLAAIISSFVYCYNTYFILGRTGHLTLMVAFSLAPLIFYLFIRTLEEKKIKLVIITGLISFICATYEFRAFYIIAFVLFFYFIYYSFFIEQFSLKTFLKNVKFALLPMALVFLTNLYWILGLFQTSSITSNTIFNRGLFGNSFMNILRSITLFHPFWTGTKLESFVVQPIPFYFWLIPTFAIIGLILNRKNKNVLFFSFISLLGIFLTKQVGEPFPHAYQWLYDHFPGFNAFRESSKFYFLIAFGYSVLIGSFISWLWRNWNKNQWQKLTKYSLILLIAGLFLWNIKSIITGEIGTLSVPRYVPNDYLILKDFLLKQSKYFRTIYVPRDSRWGIYINEKPKISNIDVIGSEWKNLLETYNKDGELIQNNIINAFRLPFANDLFDVSSIKYAIVPLQDIANDNDFFIYYGGDKNPDIHQWYIDQLDKISWLKKIDIGTKNLVVYENENYKEPIFSFSKLYDFDSINNLDSKFNFINKKLNTDFFFNVDDKKTNDQSLIKLSNPFENLSFNNIILDKQLLTATSSFFDSKINTVYTSKNVLGFSGIDAGNSIQINKNYSGKLKVNYQIVDYNNSQNILNISKNTNIQYYLQHGDNFNTFIKGDIINIGNFSNSSQISIFSSSNNLIKNPSFEEGSWQEKVGDCHNYDKDPIIGMGLNQQNKSAGWQSVQLEATKHIACIATKISIQDIGKYVLTFDYQSPNAKQASFYLNFNDKGKTVITDSVNIIDTNWNTYTKLINVPYGATSVTLHIYAKAMDNKTNIINRYDNFSFSKLNYVNSVNISKQTIKEYVKNILPKINSDDLVFTYQDKNYNYQNIIPNPSFEEGSWQEKVGDCHNYDKNPILTMNLNKELKTDGEQSLQLEATRHNACMAIRLNVNASSSYLFGFDYQSPNAGSASYYLSFNDKEKTIIKDNINIIDRNWNTFSKIIKVPEGATSVSLYVYANSIDGKINIINRYDNFKLIEIPDLSDTYYLVSDPNITLKEPSSISFDLINPTKKLVHIKGATTPFYLAMSENYHNQWQLQFNNDKVNGFFNSWMPFAKPDKISDEYHYKLNDFLNAWYMDTNEYCANNNLCVKNPDGSYDMEMVVEFFPQRWFYLGLLISGITLAGCLGYLGYYGVKKIGLKLKKK